MTKERVEKRRAEALILQAERQLKEVALDFGMQFERNRRQHIETLSWELRENLALSWNIALLRRRNDYYGLCLPPF